MIHRIDVRWSDADPRLDTQGISFAQRLAAMSPELSDIRVRSGRIYLIDSDAPSEQVHAASAELLCDPVVETAIESSPSPSLIEVHLKPGVMDPVAASAERALRDLGVPVKQIRTGRSYQLDRPLEDALLRKIAGRTLANGVIETVHLTRFHPAEFIAGHQQPFELRKVNLRTRSDEELKKLSREGHLFLSLGEMQAVQSYFQHQGREPTDIELETIAQTWSEHCVHKTLKSAVEVSEIDAAGKTVSTRQYGNLIRDTIFASTQKLIDERATDRPFCLSVFRDNAGVIVFDDDDAVCMKVETHNHPSAIEPYGGSATGIGGCIRDIMGTGLSARPIASTDVFCVAHPDLPDDQLPRGVIHPRRTLQQVVAGVRDYGNRMGIPTVNGAIFFDDRYVGNPLVFCGCVGVIPRDRIQKTARSGDAIVVMGGRTGRDGIHGATFSSAELTDTHADEFSHAVQIGNAITQKQMMDVILQARDQGLFTAVTDCGAGGLSSAVGEMGEKLGAIVELDRVPLKYDGLRYDEIWISEAQERMVLSVPAMHIDALLKLSADEDVEATVIGTFGTDGQELILRYRNETVGRLSMAFLHDGLPMPTRAATVISQRTLSLPKSVVDDSFSDRLLALLASPNIASKHWVIRQYDHEVQGGSVIKPLVGPMHIGPSDASVVRPKLDSLKGVAIGCGLAPQIKDPYDMTIAAIDEAIRNVVCVGASLDQIALLDNFCWPSVDDAETMGTLVRSCEACRDAALAFGTPFISGKDSLHNQFTDSENARVIRIPATMLISAIGVLDDVRRCVTMDLKRPEAPVILIAARDPSNLANLAATHRAVAQLIADGDVAACHDVSDGGIAVAAAEMCIASSLGMTLDPDVLQQHGTFDEAPGRYLVELELDDDDVTETFDLSESLPSKWASFASVSRVGFVQHGPRLLLANRQLLAAGAKIQQLDVARMTDAWRGTLDWSD